MLLKGFFDANKNIAPLNIFCHASYCNIWRYIYRIFSGNNIILLKLYCIILDLFHTKKSIFIQNVDENYVPFCQKLIRYFDECKFPNADTTSPDWY